MKNELKPYYRFMYDTKTKTTYYKLGCGEKKTIDGIVFYIEKIGGWWFATEETTGLKAGMEGFKYQLIQAISTPCLIQKIRSQWNEKYTILARNQLEEYKNRKDFCANIITYDEAISEWNKRCADED